MYHGLRRRCPTFAPADDAIVSSDFANERFPGFGLALRPGKRLLDWGFQQESFDTFDLHGKRCSRSSAIFQHAISEPGLNEIVGAGSPRDDCMATFSKVAG